MPKATIEVRAINAECRDDFFRVHCDPETSGWCNCVAWWVDTWEGWGARSLEANRKLRTALFDRGEYDGYLLYVDRVPVAWCQCGPRDRLPKLTRQFSLEPDPEIWAVTCFHVNPAWRGQGMAAELLAGVLRDLKLKGVQRVQAFPRSAVTSEPGELWTGPRAMYQAAGFRPVTPDPECSVFERTLNG